MCIYILGSVSIVANHRDWTARSQGQGGGEYFQIYMSLFQVVGTALPPLETLQTNTVVTVLAKELL
jgi:hypothetical protein